MTDNQIVNQVVANLINDNIIYCLIEEEEILYMRKSDNAILASRDINTNDIVFISKRLAPYVSEYLD